VYTVASSDEQALRAQLRQSRERLDGHVRDLRAVDAELDGLSGDRQRYGLLQEACGALEALSELGAAGLFWGERASDGADHVRLARGHLDAFEKRLSETEGRRQEILEALEHEEGVAAFLAGDVLQAEWQEEQRKLEWNIEREVSPLPVRRSIMPWTRGGEDDKRFWKSLATSLLVSSLLGVLIPQIDLPLPEPWEVIEVPDRLVRLIREERPLPSPPPTLAKTTPEETKPEPSEETRTPEPAPQPAPKQATKSQGILAFREQFSGLAENAPAARLGAKARITSSGDARSARPQRSMVATQAPGSSGGINLAALSRDVGGGGGDGIGGVQVTRATSSIGGLGGSDRPLSGGPGASRTDEEIQIVFDRHKAALYRLYNRELRRDPTLQGQMVLRLTIEPDGTVSLCKLQSTDMKAPQLSAQVVERVRTFDFGAKEGIPAVTIIYPIDFLPAT
jgi:outer membrane biosynthesis protein TonB